MLADERKRAGGDLSTTEDPGGAPTPAADADADIDQPDRPVPWWRRPDTIALGFFAVFALALTSPLWHHPYGRYIPVTDQYGFEWTIAAVTRSLLHFQNPFLSDLINAPLGINIMAQTSIIGLIVPTIPITVIFGPEVTFVFLLTLALAGTASAWYWVFSRHGMTSRLAAALAGGLCGFAPPMISHANGGHINYVSQFVLPFIAWQVIRLARDPRWLLNGVILGALVAWQVLIGEEPLLVAALAIVVFLVAYAASGRESVRDCVRPLLAGLGVTAVTAAALVGYPLWFQFFGPQSYGPISHVATLGNDVFSLTTYASLSIGGMRPVGGLAYNSTEENGFFGWPLLVLVLVSAMWLWRQSRLARASAVTAAVFLLFSLGQELEIGGHATGIPLPWKVFQHLPLVGSMLPSRLSFAAIPPMAILLGLATDRVLAAAPRAEKTGLPVRLLWLGAIVAVLVPIAPTRIDAIERPPAPEFFSSGTWRDYAAEGRTIVIVPPGGYENYQAYWQVAGGMGFAQIEGYFIGPHDADRHGWYGVDDQRPTSLLLADVGKTGDAARISDAQRETAKQDLRFWRADTVVLNPKAVNAAALKQTLDGLFGPGSEVGGVFVWDIRAFAS